MNGPLKRTTKILAKTTNDMIDIISVLCQNFKASPSPGRLRSHLLLAQMTDKPGDKHTDIQTRHAT